MDPQQNNPQPPPWPAVGDRVVLTEGPFVATEGEVVNVDPETGEVTVELRFWGRPVPVIVERNSIRRA